MMTKIPIPISEALHHISIDEIAGSVGNFGTVLPLFFAVSLTTGISLSLMLLVCGFWYIVTGVIYRMPISVEPLKAVAAVAIAGSATPESIAASGILIGVLFLILGLTGGLQWVLHKIPSPVIRGIQLALGLILLKSAVFDFGLRDIPFFMTCIGIMIIFLISKKRWNVPDLAALGILGIGASVVLFTTGFPEPALPTLPFLMIPQISDFANAMTELVLPQIPLTLANAVLATSLLATELYQRPVSADQLSRTIGVMSLSSSLLGGFPMCHGAGGVAAHHRFGARHGTSMVIGGTILIGAATLLTHPETLAAIPKGVFGALLLAVALELVIHGIRTDNRFIAILMGIIAIPAGIVAAFVGGLIIATLMQYRDNHSKKN